MFNAVGEVDVDGAVDGEVEQQQYMYVDIL
jgi:hypothetical protein